MAIYWKRLHVQQPPGFSDPKAPKKVLKLKKALYGLKQAPRAWNARLDQESYLNWVLSKVQKSMLSIEEVQEPKPSSPSWLVELRYGRNHPGSIPRWSELWG
jgi:hypothetical protein